ncbi:glycosyltransferase family 9 protein [Geodermatophilus marinus]|uniref:glycosyltransferase family 9 protein n=1 Tax=Geodermatophilus sp. LHW52908 TaxID=2303986 RepID=UPI000E3C5212|nr:glycosyltransferase family 9 protein [Geodermatophilus sp. LHW52908]RFU22349.1 glycosyltransferase family 9 protein [Geodermatophilus sp. LHW52908]
MSATALVLRPLGLGDLLTGVPAIRAVRAAVPDHRLVLATTAALAPLAGLVDAVDEVLPARELEPLDWDRPPPELAVDLHGKGPASHVVVADLHPGRLLTFGSPGYPGPAWYPDEHEVRRWCRLVAEGLGVPADPDALDLAVPPVPSPAPAGVAVVHPGAAFPARRWPAARFAAVARHLAARGLDVRVTGGPAEVELARSVARGAGLGEDAVLAGRTTTLELAAVVAGARVVVSGDTGTAHLATAYRRPSVVLFGPVPPALWGPPPRPQHVVLWHGDGTGDGTGDPWGAELDPALARITAEEVTAALDGLLAAR